MDLCDLFLEEFDIDFEFDAPRFYDFSRQELDSENEEIDFWFKSAGNHSPTRFIYNNQTIKEVSKTKSKLSNSTLTRPTASLIARQNKPLDSYSVQLLTRCQSSLCKFGDNLSTLSKLQNQDSKRQKFEAKVAHVCRVSKLTVPKEPKLRTAERSQRHMSKINSETVQKAKSSSNSSKRHNSINLESSSTSLPKTTKPKSQDLHAFRLRSLQKSKEHTSNVSLKSNIKSHGNQSLCRTGMKPFLDINRSMDLFQNLQGT